MYEDVAFVVEVCHGYLEVKQVCDEEPAVGLVEWSRG